MRFANLCAAFVAVVVMGAMGPAVAQTPSAPAATPPALSTGPVILNAAESTSGVYVLGRDDVVEITLLGTGGWGGRARVQADGTVQLPLIGKVPAAETTTSELSDKVRKALQTGGYYADPIVSVEVVGFASRYVTVLGNVGSVGLIPMNRPYHLSEILAKVGGVGSGAADYLIVRSERGEERRYSIRDLATGDASKDPVILAGDKIYAPIAEQYYVNGQVRNPGAFPLSGGEITVRMAIAKAGGVTESGSDKSAEVTRAGKKKKMGPDEKLQAGDIVFIKERMF